MSNATLTRPDVRKQLRTISADEFQRAHTKPALIAAAVILGVTIENESGTKAEIYAEIIKGSPLPNPALRGNSSVDGPVAFVWELADRMHQEADEENPVRRKDIVQACVDQGVAFYTARTQYQAYFVATGKGANALADMDAADLPKALQPKEEVADKS